MNTKRLAVLKVAAFASVGVLAACSGGNAPGASGGGEIVPGVPDEEVTIQVFDSYAPEDPHGQLIYEYAEAFMAEHDNVTIEITAVPSNDIFTRLAAMATDPGSLPTLYFTSADQAPSLYSLGFTQDLTNYLSEDTVQGFGSGVIDGVTFDDEVAFFPVAVQPLGILYRTDRFADANVEVPTDWDEFVEVAKALTDDEQAGFGMIGSNNSSGQSRFLSYLWSNCIDVVTRADDGTWTTDVDSQEFLEAFTKWTNMVTEDDIVPTGITTVDYPTAANYFSMGYANTMMTGGNALGVAYESNPDLKGKIGSFPIPGECPGSGLMAEGYAMSAHASDAEKATAIAYLEFFSSHDEDQKFWESAGKIPATTVGQEAEFLQGEDYEGLLETLEGETVPVINFAGMEAVKSALGEAYSSVFAGQASPEDAVNALVKEIDQILEDEN